MRILVITNKFPYPPHDGGALAVFSMIRSLHREGHKLTVLSMNTAKHHADLGDLPEDVRQLASFIAVEMDTEVKPADALRNLLFSDQSYHISRFISEGFRKQLEKILKNERFDVVQLEGLYLTPYVETIRKHPHRARVILLRAHNIEHEIWERMTQNTRNPFRKFILDVFTRRLKHYEKQQFSGNTFDGIIPITDRDADAIRKMGAKGPIHVSNAGIDPDTMGKPEPSPEMKSLYYIGALDWMPNQEGLDWFLEKVWPEVHRMYPDVKFYIAGRRMPPKYSEYRGAGVVSMGEVESAQDFMNSKGIMVVPLFSGSGMRVKIIEGMLLGKPIVATAVAVEGIPARHGKHILIASDVEAFVNCVSSLLEQPHLYEMISRNARAFSLDRFDNGKIVRELVSFYESLLGDTGFPDEDAETEDEIPEEFLPGSHSG